jgi:hypothetical protein
MLSMLKVTSPAGALLVAGSTDHSCSFTLTTVPDVLAAGVVAGEALAAGVVAAAARVVGAVVPPLSSPPHATANALRVTATMTTANSFTGILLSL